MSSTLSQNVLSSPIDINLNLESVNQVHVVFFSTASTEKRVDELFHLYVSTFHFPNYVYGEMKGAKSLSSLRTHFYVYVETSKKEKTNCSVDVDHDIIKRFSFLDIEYIYIKGDKVSFNNKVKELCQTPTNIVLAYSEDELRETQPSEKEILRHFWRDIDAYKLSDLDKTELKCRLEHNHWCAVSHLNGYKPLNEKDLELFNDFELTDKDLENLSLLDSKRWHMHKDMFRLKRLFATGKEKKHLDLCTFEELKRRDFSTIAKDLTHFNQLYSKKKDSNKKSRILDLLNNGSTCLTFAYVIFAIFFGISIYHQHCLPLSCLCCDFSYINVLSWVAFILGLGGLGFIINVCYYLLNKPNSFDRFISKFNLRNVLAVCVCIFCVPLIICIVAALFGVTNVDMFNNNGFACEVKPNLFWTFLYQFTDPGNQHMVHTEKGLYIATWVAFLGMFLLNGLLVSTIISFFNNRATNWIDGTQGKKYYIRESKHIIIIGGHDIVPGIINEIGEKHRDIEYFVIMTELDVANYRLSLLSAIKPEFEDKVIIYHGDRTSNNDIRSLHIDSKSLHSIYIVGEGTSHSDLEANHDTKNMACADLIVKERSKCTNQKIHCYTMFEHRSSYVAFQQADLPESYQNTIYFEPFNLFEMCAQNVLVCPEFPISPIDVTRFSEDKKGCKNYIDADSERRVHLVIFGMSKMGMTLASEAAIICHYPNFAKQEMLEDDGLPMNVKKGLLRTLITFIDMDAEQQMHFYQNRMPSLFEISKWGYMNAKHLMPYFSYSDNLNHPPFDYKFSHLADEGKEDKNFLDVEWEFIQGAIGDDGVDTYLEQIAKRDNEILTVAVCLPNDAESLSLATTLPVEVYDKAEQILVYQRQTGSIVKQMSGNYQEPQTTKRENKYSKLRPFGMYMTCFRQSLLDNIMATKLLRKNYEELLSIINTGKDFSNVKLYELATQPILERWSAVYSSHNWSVKFRSMGYFNQKKDEQDISFPEKEILCQEFDPKFENDNKQQCVTNPRAILWGRVEHNRWCIERLVKAGERPITFSENEKIKSFSDFKESYKLSGSRSHLDICSMKRLVECDHGTVDYDIKRNYRLVEIYDAIKK